MKNKLLQISSFFRKRNNQYQMGVIRICLIYFLIGIFWIIFSDRIVTTLFQNREMWLFVSTYKGIGYVIVTALLLYGLIRRLVKRVHDTETELNISNEELMATNEELNAYVQQIMASEEELRRQYEQIVESDKKLLISERKYKALVQEMQLGLAVYEGNQNLEVPDYILIDCNESHNRMIGMTKEFMMGKKIRDIHKNMDEMMINNLEKTIKTGVPSHYERYQPVTEVYYEVFVFQPDQDQIAVIINDITKRKELEEKLQFLSYRDQLTGLYNRRYFDMEMKRLSDSKYIPMSVTMGDVNGLKLINDSFGHATGDIYIKKIAELLEKIYTNQHVICRHGGDEFIILSPNTAEEEAQKHVLEFKKMAEQIKIREINISVSFGYATKSVEDVSLQDIIKKAEDYMYRNKMLESQSMRGAAIYTIITTLHEKNSREERHSQRVSVLCEMMGNALHLPEDQVKELKVAGLLHDIGKVAIEESILNKEGKLTKEEWEKMKQHSEIGYRILSTVNSMSEMAEYVLAHHERLDGSGYPKKLKGDEIPLQSRIIAIADSFDAMVSERSYKDSLTKEEAIEELKRNVNIQFSKELVDVFVEVIQQEDI
ncbi:MAG: diguanylate cyclase [Lachnospiraceae bacterium]|nr:diguanylate cyclase [Lachnospiraceae bacterium]